MTSLQTIREWVEASKAEGNTHCIIVCDTYDYSDYPVDVGPNDVLSEVEKKYSSNMQQIMEIYNLNMNLDKQLAQVRSFNR